MLTEKEERRIPLALTAIFYLLNFYLLKNQPLIYPLKIFLLGSCLAVVIVMIINFFWKISTHMVGIGGIIGTLIGLSFRTNSNLSLLIIIFTIFSGLVGFSRLKLNAHTPSQIYLGFLMGVITEWTLFLIF